MQWGQEAYLTLLSLAFPLSAPFLVGLQVCLFSPNVSEL